ncbi:subclass B1 metallo-beta-lactamase [Candidatus Neomarinimicrobiota bacterium]
MNNNKILSLIILIFMFSNLLAAQLKNIETVKISEELLLKEIKKDVFLITHYFPWAGNSLLVKITSSDFVLVDTPWENNGTRALVEWIYDIYGHVNLFVINTHFHRDNLGGNEYLLDQNIPIYGSDLTVTLLAKKRDELINRTLNNLRNPEYEKYYESYRRTKLMPPDNIFNIEEGLVLKIRNEQIELFYPGPGHTQDNIVVYFPSKRLLFGGCMIKSLESNLGRNSDADIIVWPNSLEALMKKYPESRVVVPGHGEYGNMDLINHTIELLNR